MTARTKRVGIFIGHDSNIDVTNIPSSIGYAEFRRRGPGSKNRIDAEMDGRMSDLVHLAGYS
jgi:hypothetical protein